MFNKTDITTKVKQYMVRESFYQSNTVQEDTLIFENGLLDSMGFLFLIDFLKEEFHIEVEDSDLVDDNFKSINNISTFVLKKLKQKE
ncbi:MAG: acyl carrier protein [Proteiniphilum sp.]|nr:acyl carrier protein [Proteiniphilum sp.]MDD3909735.1 acyl carrier protein [Proteiniphilum sp.]MDD4416635.1 acyl carrier protein [Proteiniphilum sp.]